MTILYSVFCYNYGLYPVICKIKMVEQDSPVSPLLLQPNILLLETKGHTLHGAKCMPAIGRKITRRCHSPICQQKRCSASLMAVRLIEWVVLTKYDSVLKNMASPLPQKSNAGDWLLSGYILLLDISQLDIKCVTTVPIVHEDGQANIQNEESGGGGFYF